ncbi:MAG: hypothetical protein OEY87_03500 [Gammaproteobacteria bacterium]|nr:hypothetical protein [Gammaproteobacteria bacterium]MDH5735168.1 hypothetical protein [Gammaproteobacteria bacterium]
MINVSDFNLPDWVHWIAQDHSGAWWGYQVEPLQNHHGWYENEVGKIIQLTVTTPNPEWETSLKKIK